VADLAEDTVAQERPRREERRPRNDRRPKPAAVVETAVAETPADVVAEVVVEPTAVQVAPERPQYSAERRRERGDRDRNDRPRRDNNDRVVGMGDHVPDFLMREFRTA
jgi:hypothetical protein